MTHWTRIRDVFEQAVGLAGDERTRFLDEHCGTDPELRAEVLRLLAADESDGQRLEQLADELLERLGDVAQQSALVGRTIGSYRIQGTIASGGMGTVYEALQDRPERRVALKVMKRELLGRDGRRRFEYETRVLARLRHPGIAQIYEAGSFRDDLTGGEVPYFAMEYIEGARTIVDYAREANLDLGARLELFERVCSIVHHGHQQGVIHRDLKPSNILVDYLGRPKVIDFGVARAVETDVELAPGARLEEAGNEEPSDERTQAGEILGTVQYMSPEQMSGNPDAVDTRTDIYALGVVLYELLCGCSPFPLLNLDFAEAARIVAGTEPVRPDRVRPDLPHDLVYVTLRTLEKDPDRRYGSAAELGEEVRRYLAKRPVQAVPSSVRYRLKKFLARNRSEATIAGVLLFVVTVGPVVTSLVLARVNASLQTANARYGRLADSLRLEELETQAEALWPAAPGIVDELHGWLLEATPVRDRLGTHRKTLAALGAAAATTESAEIRWQSHVLGDLVVGLERFADPDPSRGTFASVQRRLEWARSVERRTLLDYEAEWRAAREAIAGSPLYDGLELAPQLGLVPLGEDPHSGLWEFALLETGNAPERAEDGSLTIAPETGLVLVLVPGGSFLMGAWDPSSTVDAPGPRDPWSAPDERPVARVELDAFFMSKYEVTQAQWSRLAGTNPSYLQGEALVDVSPLTDGSTARLHPVERVRWVDAKETLARYGLALPTEAQWERAARGGTESVWWTGDDRESLRGVANLADRAAARAGQDWAPIAEWPDLEDGYPFHGPVDAFLPNPFGFYNIIGNVYEWCLDEYCDYAAEPAPGDGERRTETRHAKVIRGGSFLFGATKARSAERGTLPENSSDLHVGLRPVRPVDTLGAREGYPSDD